MEADAVARAVAPVHVGVTFALLNRTDGALPSEGVVGTQLTLHEAAARKTHELRMHVGKHLSQVRTHAVRTVLESWREKAHHVELETAGLVGGQHKLCFCVVTIGSDGGRIFLPCAVKFHFHFCTAQRLSLFCLEAGCERALIFCVALGPERELVGAAFNGIDAPEAFVLHAASWCAQIHVQCIVLHGILQAVFLQVDFCIANSAPGGDAVGAHVGWNLALALSGPASSPSRHHVVLE